MESEIVLNKFHTIPEFLALTQALPILEWGRKFDLYLPTEIVITSPAIQVPQVARVYLTGHLYHKGQIMIREAFEQEQRGKKNRLYAGDVSSVYLFEYWEDEGSDGHVEYRHRGYFFSTALFPDRIYPLQHLRDLYHEWRIGVED